ncbi:hypothetical protein B4135_2569 [Caldibacillus debilis]|uniref:Sporulation protein YjcZ n=1 Tax=Caldibacillus debilis TaxID=301148 RepID=A0A150LYI6_9BACI|nr:hypothetical protein B4135_2569 [Caldibacillus debilis]
MDTPERPKSLDRSTFLEGGVCMSFGNQGFVLIVILFILLILVGCSCGF